MHGRESTRLKSAEDFALQELIIIAFEKHPKFGESQQVTLPSQRTKQEPEPEHNRVTMIARRFHPATSATDYPVASIDLHADSTPFEDPLLKEARQTKLACLGASHHPLKESSGPTGPGEIPVYSCICAHTGGYHGRCPAAGARTWAVACTARNG